MSDEKQATELGPPWTTLKILRWTQGFFEDKGLVDSPRVDAEVLLAHVLGLPRIELYAAFDRPMGPDELAEYRALIKRRLAGEPVAYLTGSRGFWSIDLKTDARALIPRPETEHVVEAALDFLEEDDVDAAVIDVGTGTGAIALALADERPNIRVAATEIDPDTAALARENVEALEFGGRVEVVECDLFEEVSEDFFPADLIVSNPPYIAENERDEVMRDVHENEPHEALYAGEDGLDVIRRLVPEAAERLRSGGQLIVEIGYRQGDAVRGIFEDAGFDNVTVRKDYADHDRVVVGTRP
ncbi:MAG: peptide chain release factor N(5)-glutamine methyltransferase [Myxococcota bacterium]